MSNNERPISYQMTKKMFNSMLESRSEAQKKENPYNYVMKIINNEFGLRGTVVALSIV